MSLSKVWVYAEASEGKPTTLTLELLTKARELGRLRSRRSTPARDAAARRRRARRPRRHEGATRPAI